MDEKQTYELVQGLVGIGIVIVAIWAVLMAAGVMVFTSRLMFELVF